MALVASGTINNNVERTGNMPAWATFTSCGFFKVPSDTNELQIVASFGGTDGFFAPQVNSDGSTLGYYNERGTYGALALALTMNQWYFLDYTVDGVNATLRIYNLATEVTTTITGTHSSATSPLTMGTFTLGDYHYSSRSRLKYAGWHLWNQVLTETQRNAQRGSLAALVTGTNLKGSWPMDGSTLAACLTDAAGLGNLVENGTAGYTVDADLPALASPISGALSVTLADAVLSAAGQLSIAGTANVTLASAVLSAAGQLSIAGVSSVTLANAILSAAGKLDIAGSANVTLADAILSASGQLLIQGTAGIVLADAVLSAASTLTWPPNEGSANVTLADAILSAAGKLDIAGAGNVTLADAVLTAAAQLLVTGSASVTLSDAVLTAAGVIGDVITGAASVQLQDAVLTAAGALALAGQAGVQLEDAVLAAAGALLIQGLAGVQLEDAVLTAAGAEIPIINGVLSVTLADAVLVARALLRTPGVVYNPLTAADIQQYLDDRYTPPRRRGKRLSIAELLYLSQRDDVARRRSEGT